MESPPAGGVCCVIDLEMFSLGTALWHATAICLSRGRMCLWVFAWGTVNVTSWEK